MHWYYALFCMCYILQWRSIFKNCYTSFVFTKLTLVSGSSFFAGKTAYEKYLKWIPCGCSHCKLGILPFFKQFFFFFFWFFLSLSNSLTEVLHKIKFVFWKSIVENTIISCIRERISLYYSFPLVAHRIVILKCISLLKDNLVNTTLKQNLLNIITWDILKTSVLFV